MDCFIHRHMFPKSIQSRRYWMGLELGTLDSRVWLHWFVRSLSVCVHMQLDVSSPKALLSYFNNLELHSNMFCALDGGCSCPFCSQQCPGRAGWLLRLNWGEGRLAVAHEEAQSSGGSVRHCSGVQNCHTELHPRYIYYSLLWSFLEYEGRSTFFLITIGWMVYND